MKDFLLEVGTEDIPSRFMPSTLEQLAARFRAFLKDSRLPHSSVKAYGTHRRLVVEVKGLAPHQEETTVEAKGPARKAAFDAEGRPTRAAEGFARGQGVRVEDLVTRTTPQGEYVFAVRRDRGLPAAEVLAQAVPGLVTGLEFPKQMRWGAGEYRFVRPVKWVVALLGTDIVPMTILGVPSGRTSRGHRFLAPRPFRLTSAGEYLSAVHQAMVIVEPERRREMIHDSARSAAAKAGGRPHEDPDLLEELVFLVEYPTAVLGSFPAEFLELPAEVLITTMQHHQKYFAAKAYEEEPELQLLPNFIAFRDGGTEGLDVVRAGYEKVLRARLADAKFFFDQDRERSLEDWAAQLTTIAFQDKLGTLAGKASRLEWLARALAPKVGLDPARAARAARLLKADLATNLVREFTELQGTMGRVYARLSGEGDDVAEAIFEHYLPRFAGDELAQTRMGQLMSVLDKVDSLVGFFAVGLAPTGSQDPYALRRQAVGLVATLVEAGFPFGIEGLVSEGVAAYLNERFEVVGTAAVGSAVMSAAMPAGRPKPEDFARGAAELREFLQSRVRAYLEEQGFRYDVVEAVVGAINSAAGPGAGARNGTGAGADVPADMADRAAALAAFRETDGFADAVIAFGRAANLGGRSPEREVDPRLLKDPAEVALNKGFQEVRGRAREMLATHRYGDLLATVAQLRPAVDRFFEAVMVMVDDEAVRNNRLALLKGISSLVGQVADFSKLVVSKDELGGPGK